MNNCNQAISLVDRTAVYRPMIQFKVWTETRNKATAYEYKQTMEASPLTARYTCACVVTAYFTKRLRVFTFFIFVNSDLSEKNRDY